jgi:hypothetical protein
MPYIPCVSNGDTNMTLEIIAARAKAAIAEQHYDIARRALERALAAAARAEREFAEAKSRLYDLEDAA